MSKASNGPGYLKNLMLGLAVGGAITSLTPKSGQITRLSDRLISGRFKNPQNKILLRLHAGLLKSGALFCARPAFFYSINIVNIFSGTSNQPLVQAICAFIGI